MGVWLAIISLVAVWYVMRPVVFDVSLSLEVTRDSSTDTADYQYDQFYRLEADDKFADTIVRWMKDPAVVHAVLSQANIPTEGTTLDNLSGTFSVEKLASNYIQVRFQVPDKKYGEKIHQGIEQVIKEKIEGLNRQPQSKNWFSLVYGKPIIAQAKISVVVVLMVALLGGSLSAVMGVLLVHYWRE